MQRGNIIRALFLANLTSFVLFVVRALSQRSFEYLYLNWNLLLAWLPLFFGVLLLEKLNKYPWKHWSCVFLFILWLGFLPNSFYIMTDLIHLQHTATTYLLFDVVMIFSYSLNGLILGYLSVFMVHEYIKKRTTPFVSNIFIAVIFLLCSFAIYLGRYMRWNTWDVLINPGGILFDVSDRFINPDAHGQTFSTTALFLFFLGMTYIVIRQFAYIIKKTKLP